MKDIAESQRVDLSADFAAIADIAEQRYANIVTSTKTIAWHGRSVPCNALLPIFER